MPGQNISHQDLPNGVSIYNVSVGFDSVFWQQFILGIVA
jgi:hypothetical protein